MDWKIRDMLTERDAWCELLPSANKDAMGTSETWIRSVD